MGRLDTYTNPPTLQLPAGGLTCRVCARCLTLLSQIITRFGDGNGYSTLHLIHSRMDVLSTTCPICLKAKILFDNARRHVSFLEELVNSPVVEWTLTWNLHGSNPAQYPNTKLPYDSASVRFSADYDAGYGWGIGGFTFEMDGTGSEAATDKDMITSLQIDSLEDKLQQASLADTTQQRQAEKPLPDFTRFRQWQFNCLKSHAKCKQPYGSADPHWYPDRLIFFDRQSCFRVVEKHDPSDAAVFDTIRNSTIARVFGGMPYASLSHCWGPAPHPDLPNGGRPVLTQANLADFKITLPDTLDLTHRHALLTAALMGYQFCWIDSICIIQDSIEDWQVQSATMSDVYKHAGVNIAALTTAADHEGFFPPPRDLQVEFGFKAPWSLLLGRAEGEVRSETSWDGTTGVLLQECALLRGSAKIIWGYDHTMMPSAANCALYKRGWVYQERSLARRTLAFASSGVSWSCDQGHEEEAAGRAMTTVSPVRSYQAWATLDTTGLSPEAYDKAIRGRAATLWQTTLTDYTACALTKQTDKLIAISAVARELADKKRLLGRYLAGLWEYGLVGQLPWLNVDGINTPPRKRHGDEEYAAPSWSWASITTKVQPKSPFAPVEEGGRYVPLVDVKEASVQTVTDFEFGQVKSGHLRIHGALHPIAEVLKKQENGKTRFSLRDHTTSESLWFSGDTVESYQLTQDDYSRIRWMPHHVRFDDHMVECTCIVLIRTAESEDTGYTQMRDTPVQVYRRLGIGNFGRVINMMAQDKLLMQLGMYTVMQRNAGSDMAKNFRRNETVFEEFVIV